VRRGSRENTEGSPADGFPASCLPAAHGPGIHAKKWTRNQAIDYLKQNTPNSESDCVDAINRYIVMPSQATAYKIGMLKILELREKAKRALGATFDIHQFHDVVLTNGALPLDVLENFSKPLD